MLKGSPTKNIFLNLYLIYSKSKTEDILNIFFRELGIPEKLTFNVSKEQ